MIIGKTRTNQPVEGDNDALALSLTGKDIAPKDVNATGKVSGAEIVENMTGYSMTSVEIENITKTPVYGGIVKNGNKLTIVFACDLNRSDSVGGNASICSITIPSAIGEKLFVSIGTYTLVRNKQYCANKTTSENDIEVVTSVFKESNTNITIRVGDLNALTVGSTYYLRCEYTFLLSDNLLA